MHALVLFYYINDLICGKAGGWFTLSKSFMVDCHGASFFHFDLESFLSLFVPILFLSKIYVGILGFQTPSGT